jgi:hypothetical protein
MTEGAVDAYTLAKDFALPILAVVFSALISWLVAGYSARQGAKFGAQAASALEREKDEKLVRTKQAENLQKTIFMLSMQINDLSIWWKHVRAHIEDETAWISLPAFEDILAKDFIISVDGIGFLWSESKTSAELLVDLSIAQSQYAHVRESMNERSRFHREVLQPSIAKIAVVRDPATQMVGFDLNKLSWDVREKAQRNTLNVFEHVAKTLNHHVKLIDRVVDAAKQRFPDVKFPRVR